MNTKTANGVLGLAAVAIVAGLLSACASTSGGGGTAQTGPQSADAAVQGGINALPGSEEDFMVNVGRRTFFSQGSADLDDTARVTLDKQAQWLQQYPQWKVKLQGFADDPGSTAQQTTLSQKRADAARDYLVSRGISADRMKAKGYGRDRLVSDCVDIECKAQNRRVITNPQEAPDF
jgi:peptidoglycan-associated lipoprotein